MSTTGCIITCLFIHISDYSLTWQKEAKKINKYCDKVADVTQEMHISVVVL